MRIYNQIYSKLNFAHTEINDFLLKLKHQVDDQLLNNYAQITTEKLFEGYIKDTIKVCVSQLEHKK